MKQKKAIVFFSAGLGDALLLLPLVKRLKKKGFMVSGMFSSPQPCREMIENTGLLEECLESTAPLQKLKKGLAHFQGFDLALLNQFARGRADHFTARLLAKEVVELKKGIQNIHDAEQNLRLIDERGFKPEELGIQITGQKITGLPLEYIVLQTSSGNPKVAYKNWPLENWKTVIRNIIRDYPDKKVVLAGTQHDRAFCEELQQEWPLNCLSLAGKTSITEIMNVLQGCSLFVGLDGGLMHLAVAFGKPTFTLWGPSSELLYGYQQFDAIQHQCIYVKTDCRPCNAWIAPNRLRVALPELCPDFACLRKLNAEEVYSRFINYVTSLPGHVW